MVNDTHVGIIPGCRRTIDCPSGEPVVNVGKVTQAEARAQYDTGLGSINIYYERFDLHGSPCVDARVPEYALYMYV